MLKIARKATGRKGSKSLEAVGVLNRKRFLRIQEGGLLDVWRQRHFPQLATSSRPMPYSRVVDFTDYDA
jgi:hypothetical protein